MRQGHPAPAGKATPSAGTAFAKNSKTKARRLWPRALALGFTAAFVFLVIGHATILWSIPPLRTDNPDSTALMRQRVEEAAAEGRSSPKEQIWKPLDQISPNVVTSLITAEDPRFYQHHGIDWEAAHNALAINWEDGNFTRGGSTLTQQLAKNLFLNTSKSPLRKLHEALIAYELEVVLGKERIIELYLNVAEWGTDIYGVEAAAQHYFHTSARELNVEQSAFLVAMLPGPRDYLNPSLNPERVNYRTSLILRRMHVLEEVSEEALRARATYTVTPDFPAASKTSGMQGVAVADVEVGKEGEVLKVEVTDAPDEEIKGAVEKAVRLWKFTPLEGRIKLTRGKLMFFYVNKEGRQHVRNAAEPPTGEALTETTKTWTKSSPHR